MRTLSSLPSRVGPASKTVRGDQRRTRQLNGGGRTPSPASVVLASCVLRPHVRLMLSSCAVKSDLTLRDVRGRQRPGPVHFVQSGRGMAWKFGGLAGRTKTTRIFPPDRGEPLIRASVRVKQRGEGTSCLPLSGEDSAISHLAVDHTCHSQMPALSFLPGRRRERGGGGERPLQVSIKRFKSFSAESETRPEDAAWHAGGALVRGSCHDDGDEGNKTDGEDNDEIGRRRREGR